MSRYDPVRLAVITGGLALTGALVGALAGATALAIVMLLSSEVARSSELLTIAAQVGALLGAISAPLVVWVILPRVPLGHAFLRLTLGTIVSGVLGRSQRGSMMVVEVRCKKFGSSSTYPTKPAAAAPIAAASATKMSRMGKLIIFKDEMAGWVCRIE